MQLTTHINLRDRGIPETLQENSLTDFNLQGELSSFVSGEGATLGVTSVMSFAIWCKQTQESHFGQDIAFAYRPTIGGFANHFEFKTAFRSPAGQPVNCVVQMNDASSVLRQNQRWDGVIDGGENTWHHYVFTWDGTSDSNSTVLYVDGVDAVASKVSLTNLDGSTVTDTARDIYIGGNITGLGATWNGPIYSCALYDRVLTAAEAAAMYNGGNARDFDLETNHGSYQAADNLQHYYRPGIGSTDSEFGTDYGVGSPLINLENTNITTGFQTEDIPQATGHYQGYRSTNIHYMQKSSATLGLSDEHTVMLWMRRKGTFFSRRIFDSAGANTVDNRRTLFHNNTNEVQWELRGPSGSSSASLVLSYQITDLSNSGVSVPWEQYVFVYDGTNASDNDLLIYLNAVELGTTAGAGPGEPYLVKVNDGNPNQTDTTVNTAIGGNVDVSLGSAWDGEIWHVAIWDSVLSAAEITALYAGGSPADLELDSNFGNYTSSGNLQHWWTWEDEMDRGKDLGLLPRNLGDDADGSPSVGASAFWSLAEYPGSPGDSTT